MSDASAAGEMGTWSAAAGEAARPWYRSWSAAGHAAIAAQLAALLGLLYFLEIEPDAGLPRILPLVFAGFLAHAATPPKYRLQLFLLLSVAAIGVVLGAAQGIVVVAIALGLIGICHLPIGFGMRVALLGLAGVALAAARVGSSSALAALHISAPALAVIGSMFMFRMIIYMYDLRNDEKARALGKNLPGADASIWARISYFFLLPNVCFLLFPVIDYRTYRRTYYDAEPTLIYQKGIWWIALGLAYLLAYRFVYHYLVLAPEQVDSLKGVVRFMVGSYLVYLRVVGQFHLVIGLLCLFGFNLPPAHRFFLLAAGFTDFWRRTRIDWKDFMIKVVYFPASVPLQRRWGTKPALVMATIGVFTATWILHSYQWFWLRGDFPVSANDLVFWGIFGACVLVNSLIEASSRRTKKRETITFASAAGRAVRVAGMFIFLSALWSYWSSPSLGDWLWTLASLKTAPAESYVRLIAATAGATLVLACAHFAFARITTEGASLASRGQSAPRQPIIPPRLRPVGVAILVAAVLLALLPARRGAYGASAQRLADNMATSRLNAADRVRENRGYYETLLDTRRSIADVGDPAREAAEAGVVLPVMRMRFVRKTNDLLGYELIPSYRGGFFRGARFETNKWGMRDKEYALVPPPNTYRIVLLGASYEMGASVKVDQAFPWLLEDRLNREGPGAPARHYEILNLAVGGYALVQNVMVADRRAFRFSPDALVIGLKKTDIGRGIDVLVAAIRDSAEIPYPELREMLRRAGAEPGLPYLELRRRVRPIMPDIVQWSLDRIIRVCRAHGTPAIAVIVPSTDPEPGDAELEGQLATWARQSGFSVVDLKGVFSGHPRDSISIPPPDGHPNALGQRLLADRLYELLRDHDASLLKLGFQQSPR
jgi:hypothetical protein